LGSRQRYVLELTPEREGGYPVSSRLDVFAEWS
jgi:hypothetical protein